jgi:hypothetical protein
MWGCGCSVCPQVWRTLRNPIFAPRCFGSAATSSRVAALESNRSLKREHLLVLPDERNQLMWHAEYQVVIVGRKQLLPAGGQPLITRVGLALTQKQRRVDLLITG